jgi:hypothetical protein
MTLLLLLTGVCLQTLSLTGTMRAHLASEHAAHIDPAPIARAIVRSGGDAALLAAVSWVESRHQPVIGDGGLSCGPWQQQARYSPGYAGAHWRTPPATICGRPVVDDRDAECARLLADPDYAACIAAYQLARYRPCQYNAGPGRCSVGMAYEERVLRARRWYDGIF